MRLLQLCGEGAVGSLQSGSLRLKRSQPFLRSNVRRQVLNLSARTACNTSTLMGVASAASASGVRSLVIELQLCCKGAVRGLQHGGPRLKRCRPFLRSMQL